MNILVTGANGLVGSHFTDQIDSSKFNLLTPPMEELDVTNKNSVGTFFEKNSIDIVVHFAAYTDVTSAEKERDNKSGACWRVNVEGTKSICEASKNAFFVFISSDMVFSGEPSDKGPYNVDHETQKDSSKLPWYGYTKVVGEDLVKKTHANSAIIRISNPVRKNFLLRQDYIQKIVQSYNQKGSISLFNDQYLTLSYIPHVSDALNVIIDSHKSGIFHISSLDTFTPFELGKYVLHKNISKLDNISASSLQEYVQKTNLKSRYPQYGGLSVDTTMKKLGLSFTTWKQIVDLIIC